MTDPTPQTAALRDRLLRASAAGTFGVVVLGAAGVGVGVVALRNSASPAGATTAGSHQTNGTSQRQGSAAGQGASSTPGIGSVPAPSTPQAGSNGS